MKNLFDLKQIERFAQQERKQRKAVEKLNLETERFIKSNEELLAKLVAK